jgi:hypothetical protein
MVPGLATMSELCFNQGCSVRFSGSKGSIDVHESLRTLELFEGFDVQCWKRDPWASPTASKISQLDENIYRLKMGKEKDTERDHATIQLKGPGCSAQVYRAH